MTQSDDERVAAEIARCEALAPRYANREDGDGLVSSHAYHLARATLLKGVTTEQAVRFLREEALDALAHGMGGGPAATAKTDRWLRLQELDFLGHQQRKAMLRRMRRVVGMSTAGLAAIEAPPDGA